MNTAIRHHRAIQSLASRHDVCRQVEGKWSHTPVEVNEVFDDGSERYIRQLDALICTLGITFAGVVIAALVVFA